MSNRIVLVVLAVLVVALGPEVSGAADDPQIDAFVLESQILSRGILIDLREIQTLYPAETSTSDMRESAQRRLGTTQSLVLAFQDHQGTSRQVLRKLLESPDPGRLHQKARAATSQLDRHRALVQKFYDRAVGRYGPPQVQGGQASTTRTGPAAGISGVQIRIRGTAQSALGSSAHRQKGVSNGLDESSKVFEGNVTARAKLPNGTALQADLSRETRVVRQETTITDARFGVIHELAPGLEAEGSFGYRGYEGTLGYLGYGTPVEEVGFGETQLRAAARMNRSGTKFEAGVEKRGRSYSRNDPRGQDFDVTKLDGRFEVAAGGGRISGAITKLHREGETPGQEFDILHPSVTWSSHETGSEVRASIERYDAPNDEARNNDRIKVHAYRGKTLPDGRSRYGLEFQRFEYPDLPEGTIDPSYMDAGFGGRASSIQKEGNRGSRMRKRWRAFYRRHEEKARFDFVSTSFSRRSRPIGFGFGTELGLTAKVFVEGGDNDDLFELSPNPTDIELFSAIGELVQAFQNPRDPHQIDFLARLQWTVATAASWLPMIEIAPSVGHLMFIDSERNRLQNDAEDLADQLSQSISNNQPLGEVDFLYRNTINRARTGARVTTRLVPTLASQVEVAVQYDTDILYNADPVQTLRTFDVDVTGNLSLRQDIRLEGRLNIHRSRVGKGTGRDFDRHEAFVRIQYLFDVGVSS